MGSENLIGLRSDHSSRRQVMTVTGRREAGDVWRKLQGMRNAECRPEKTMQNWRAGYREIGPSGSVGGSQKPDLATGEGAGSLPNITAIWTGCRVALPGGGAGSVFAARDRLGNGGDPRRSTD